jgi:hypothetical protein
MSFRFTTTSSVNEKCWSRKERKKKEKKKRKKEKKEKKKKKERGHRKAKDETRRSMVERNENAPATGRKHKKSIRLCFRTRSTHTQEYNAFARCYED